MKGQVQGSETGTTTGSYVAALDVETAQHRSCTFLVANTGVTNTIYYKIWVYAKYGGTNYVEYVGETSIGTSTVVEVNVTETAYAEVVIYVKNNAGASTYGIDYILKP